MRQVIPDPGMVAAAVAGRVDALEGRLDRLDRDVTALGRGMAGVSAALSDLTAQLDLPTVPIDAPTCWVEVDDPDTAAEWLLDTARWVRDRWDAITDGRHLPACWAWHPRAVTELLALKAAHAAAYAAGPLVVVDFEHRHLPDGLQILDRVLAACARDGGHVDAAGAPYLTDTSADALVTLAAWWATDRAGTSPGQTRQEGRR